MTVADPNSDVAPDQSKRPKLAASGLSAFETESVESCPSLGPDFSGSFPSRLAHSDPAGMCQERKLG
jgi:hypothetical protein